MRVLIFSTSTGEGHNGASKAIKEYLVEQGVDAKVLDILNEGKRKKSKTVSKTYDFVVNHIPFLFGALYRIGEWISSDKRHSPIYFLNSLYADGLHRKIMRLRPEVIVCPHMFGAHAVTKLIERYDLRIPTVGVITDYTCSPFWEETKLDYYVVANEAVANECAGKGMRRDKLLPLGIPVNGRFQVKYTKREARRAFGITKEKVIVILGGSMGYGKIPRMVESLRKRLPDVQIVAVCGKNRKAYEKVNKVLGVLALEYIDNVDVLMDAADILLTKPGGLTTTEAMTKRVPFIITLPIPGGEARNAELISHMGMAVSVNTVKGAVDAVCGLLENPKARDRMIAAQEKHHNKNSTKDVGDLIIGLAKGFGG